MFNVAVLALDQVMGFELMIPGQVFGMANAVAQESGGQDAQSPQREQPKYTVRICGTQSVIHTAMDWGEVEIHTPYGTEALADADLVIVPGAHSFRGDPAPEAVEALQAAAERGTRIASMCVGAFTLAAAGLLDGRRATTHWMWADELARRYPRIDVDPNVLFLDEGQVLTSAGVASGLDMCLHLVRQHAGPELAGRTARRIVIPAWRDGGQAQYIEHARPVEGGQTLQRTIVWLEENAAKQLDLHSIARHAGISVRSLNRQFREQVDVTPLELLTRIRVDRAQRLLESTTLTMDRIAERSGFGSDASLRYHFARIKGITPHRYRTTYTPLL